MSKAWRTRYHRHIKSGSLRTSQAPGRRRDLQLVLVGLLTGWPNTVSSMFAAGVDITPIKVGSRDDYEQLGPALCAAVL